MKKIEISIEEDMLKLLECEAKNNGKNLQEMASQALAEWIDSRESWLRFCTLPDRAFGGGPHDGSINHDDYLYGGDKQD